jgi:hypothetical protein
VDFRTVDVILLDVAIVGTKSRREHIDMRHFFTLGVTLAVFASLRADEQQHGHDTLTEQ